MANMHDSFLPELDEDQARFLDALENAIEHYSDMLTEGISTRNLNISQLASNGFMGIQVGLLKTMYMEMLQQTAVLEAIRYELSNRQ